jgi:Flp pilus assembly protein TadG
MMAKTNTWLGWTRGCRRGQALVEFTLASMVLMTLLIGITEFSRHYFARLSARHAVAEAARFAITGQVLDDPDTGDPMTRAESIEYVITRIADDLPLAIEDIELDPADGGGPNDVVSIRATYRFFFATGEIVRAFAPVSVAFTVATTVKNEPVFNP